MSSSFGPSKFGGGMKAADRPSRNVGKATAADLTAKRPKPKLKKVMPEVWKLVKPRRWLLLGSFLLIILNRLCSFALPVSSRYLINNVMNRHQFQPVALHHRRRCRRYLSSRRSPPTPSPNSSRPPASASSQSSAPRSSATSAVSRSPSTTKTAPALSSPAS